MQNVSHDLRTPISTIKGYVSAILDGIIQEPAQQEKYLVRVHEKVNQLNTMVQELFDLSQLESRQLQLQLVQTPVVDFIRGVSEKCSMDMSQANVSLCIFYPDKWEEPNSDISELFMEVDIQRIDRVFTNLLSNAIKFTPEDGQIYLSFDLINKNKMLQIVISDTGIGMSDEDQTHIFERFYVVSKARKAGTSSSGLGLAIVKEIVEYHNGQIFVKSKLGEGSRFTITLPVCENMS
jgi:signal transduction histidine kinase